ncbi:AbfB domain-containing protein [Catellatospora methionotrophica]|uniref:AbfB domain-containing protein n=1 Tax=Catellatospora methionotrophica TaxID=121620 RepID=UPI003F4CCAAB
MIAHYDRPVGAPAHRSLPAAAGGRPFTVPGGAPCSTEHGPSCSPWPRLPGGRPFRPRHLRHSDYRVRLDAFSSAPLYAADATFCAQPGNATAGCRGSRTTSPTATCATTTARCGRRTGRRRPGQLRRRHQLADGRAVGAVTS